MYKVLIAESSDVAGRYLAQLLCRDYCVYVRREEPLLTLVESWQPDVLIMDLHLSECAGLQLLASLMELSHRPMIIGMTRYADTEVRQLACQFQVDFLICRPCPLPYVADHVRRLLQYGNLQAQYPAYAEQKIALHLKRLGLPAHLDGCKYLCEALRQLLHNPDQRYTKELYPGVGKTFGVNPERVERCIRDAISKAWLHRDEKIWCMYFPLTGLDGIAKPTNTQFIASILRELQCNM